MLTSIQSRQTSAAFSTPAQQNTHQKKPFVLFSDEVKAAAATPRTTALEGSGAKMSSRQNTVTPKNSTAARTSTTRSLALTSKSAASGLSRAGGTLSPSTAVAVTAKATGPAASKAGTVKASEDTGTPPPVDPVALLSAALVELGYDPSKFKIESREEYVMFPGGGYTHRYTHVDLPNGTQENFSTDLMAKYPTITANEIKRLMEHNYLT